MNLLRFKIMFTVTLLLSIISSEFVLAHPGKLDGNKGHNCTQTSITKGLCTSYHYHYSDGTTGSSPSNTDYNSTKPKAIEVYINSSKLTLDQLPTIENGRTLVPLRGIFEGLGATVHWDSKNKLITAIAQTNTKVQLKIGSKTPTINGNIHGIDVPAKILNGRTLVPLRFVSEALGGTVDYNSTTKRISITPKAVVKNTDALYGAVTKVVDGDTIKVNINGKEESIRLLLIDTPETVHPNMPVQPFGKEASDYVKSLLPVGKVVKVELDVSERDKYGRLLAYLYVDGKMLNETLLEQGLARVDYIYPPNIRYVDQFKQIQRIAERNKLGIWSMENYAIVA